MLSNSTPVPLNIISSVIVKVSSKDSISQEQYNIEKLNIDQQIAKLLGNGYTIELTEWLFEKGLIKNDQYCSIHINNNGRDYKYKLGFYQKKIENSNYIWVSRCCPKKIISIYNNSIFHESSNNVIKIIKLIYYWLFQNQINHIMSWLNVSNNYLNKIYSFNRAVCIAGNHEHIKLMGGKDIRIEIVYLRLLDTRNESTYKIDILGVMEVDTKRIRLKAFNSNEMELNSTCGSLYVFKHLLDWINIDSILCIDNMISNQTLIALGFLNVNVGPTYKEGTLGSNYKLDNISSYHNHNVSYYVRHTVKSLLGLKLINQPLHIIQQFLEELVWRENFGRTPYLSYNNFMLHLGEITQLKLNETLIELFNKILNNCNNKLWNYKNCIAASSAQGVLMKDKIIFKDVNNSNDMNDDDEEDDSNLCHLVNEDGEDDYDENPILGS